MKITYIGESILSEFSNPVNHSGPKKITRISKKIDNTEGIKRDSVTIVEI